MQRQVVRLTRQELYEKMWLRPAISLAAEFGISGRGLGKICSRFEIPVPPRGYWARLAAGKQVTKAPLPTAKSDVPSENLDSAFARGLGSCLAGAGSSRGHRRPRESRSNPSSGNAPQPAPNCRTLARAEARAPESRPAIWPQEEPPSTRLNAASSGFLARSSVRLKSSDTRSRKLAGRSISRSERRDSTTKFQSTTSKSKFN